MERLKGYGKFTDMASDYRFTFQYGEIKRLTRLLMAQSDMTFTFQYGEIKSGAASTSKLVERNLHSSMERLKVSSTSEKHKLCYHLHSSMERLKVIKDAWSESLKKFTFQYGEIKSLNTVENLTPKKNIYIPVWRD